MATGKMAAEFIEIESTHQINRDGVRFPPILTPNTSTKTLTDFLSSIQSHKHHLQSRLDRAGAVLFRGFAVESAADFDQMIEAFGYEEFPYLGGVGLRSVVEGRVVTANDAPRNVEIAFHHEMAHALEFPSKLFFFCEVEPASGGETPLALSHVVCKKMKERHPEFVKELAEHGLIYTRVLADDDDTSSALGRGWKSMLGTDDKKIAEERAAKKGLKLEWLEDGVRTSMGPYPGIRLDEIRQQEVWFNSVVIAYTSLVDVRNDPSKAVTLGNGKPLPADIVYDCVKILEEESVAIPWQKGDILLVDNWAVLHARRSFLPPRRILASLCK